MEESCCTRLQVEGMMCQASCGTTIENALHAVEGVSSATASYALGEATVWHSHETSQSTIVDAVEGVGFGAEVIPTRLSVEGMMCQASCGSTVQSALLALDGVTSAEVSYARKMATIVGTAPLAALIDAVEGVGFEASLYQEQQQRSSEDVTSSSTTVVKKSELVVDGMRSVSDGKRVQEAATRVKGATRCDVMVAAGRCVVSHDFNVPVNDFVDAVKIAGFECRAADQEDQDAAKTDNVFYLRVEGMSCAACSAKVEKALMVLPEVESATVSSTTHKAKVVSSASAKKTSRDQIFDRLIETIESLGFKASRVGTQQHQDDAAANEVRGWRATLLTSVLLSLPLLLCKWSSSCFSRAEEFWMSGAACDGSVTRLALWEFLLGSLIQLLVGGRFLTAAVRGVRNANYGMDLLVALATSIVYTYSTLSLVECCALKSSHDHSMYDTAAMLLLFVSLGKFLEATAKQRASGAIAALLRLQPKMALKMVAGESVAKNAVESGDDAELRSAFAACEIELVQAANLKEGDVVVVHPGGAVPADGIVACALDSVGFVDEAAVTGESTPATKRIGDVVFGGGINRGATLVVTATQTGDATTIAQIARLVEEAQLSKAPVQEYADAIASRFTPTILLLAIITFTSWYAAASYSVVPREWLDEPNPFLFALLFGVSVVVVACPCALGLATPTAVMVGTGVGASLGVLVKGGDVLETAHNIDTVVFDKTGTLTTGEPTVTDVVALGNNQNEDASSWALSVAASAESGSEHPLGKALVRAAKDRNLTLDVVESSTPEPGKGVTATLKKHGRVSVGSVDMTSPRADVVSSGVVERLRRQAKTVVVLSVENRGGVVAVFGIADAPRPEAARTVAALRRTRDGRKIDVWMLTGDHQATALAVAEQLNIPPESVMAGVLPAAKSHFIKELQRKNKTVAMVGDGVNDSPALAVANVGMAVGGGTQVAVEAADVVLVKSDLRDVVVALDLARAVYRRIRLNFLWATIYNIFLIPLAAGAAYPLYRTRLQPTTAALCMAFSSVSVVCSSLALKLYVPPKLEDDEHSKTTCFASETTEEYDDDELDLKDTTSTTFAAWKRRLRVRCRHWIYALSGVHLYSKNFDDHPPSFDSTMGVETAADSGKQLESLV